MKHHVASIRKVAAEIGIGYDDLRNNYQSLTGFPGKTSKGHDCKAIAKFIKDQKSSEAGLMRGANNDLRRTKLEYEIAILAVAVRLAEEKAVDIAEVRATLSEYVAIVRGACDQEVERVAHEKPDPATLEIAENMRDAILNNIHRRLGE